MNLKYRLGASKYGAGVFAQIKISKGDILFDDYIPDQILVSHHEFSFLSDIEKKFIRDFSYRYPEGYYIPKDQHRMHISYYINSSDDPNIVFNNNIFIAIKDIEIGDEIFLDYITYDSL